jgi:hypothetical protein
MRTRVTVTATFPVSLERAFKSPMLCDVSKVHTGFGLMPKVTHCTEDDNWGKVGSSKKVFVAKSLTHQGGFGSVDHVVERIENEYWKIQVDQFQAWMLSFNKFVGEWRTTAISSNETRIEYTYTMHSTNPLLFPFTWLFTKLFWKRYMRQVLENVRQLAMKNEPYLYP